MKTTTKDFKLFKQECQKWIDYFGLKDWSVIYSHEETENDRANAEYWASSEDCLIQIIFGKEIGNKDKVKVSGFHEVTEGMLLSRLITLAKSKHATTSEIEIEVHSIVRTLKNTVFKDVKP